MTNEKKISEISTTVVFFKYLNFFQYARNVCKGARNGKDISIFGILPLIPNSRRWLRYQASSFCELPSMFHVCIFLGCLLLIGFKLHGSLCKSCPSRLIKRYEIESCCCRIPHDFISHHSNEIACKCLLVFGVNHFRNALEKNVYLKVQKN